MAGILKFSMIALKNLFSKPVTRNYPELSAKSNSASRGSVQIDIEQCVFCGLCMRRCPSEAITVDRTQKTWAIQRMGCVQCADCVSNCPKKCLSMNPRYTPPSSVKTVDTYQKEQPVPTPDGMVADKKPDTALLMDMTGCVLCGLCVRQCPVGAIQVDRATKTWTIDRSACLLCGACAQRCPKKCLRLGQASEATIQTSVYTKACAAPSAMPSPAKEASAKPTAKEELPQKAVRMLHMDMTACVLCGLCVKQCPVGAITVDRTAKTWTIVRSECLLCGICAQRCPKKCLEVKEASEADLSISAYTKVEESVSSAAHIALDSLDTKPEASEKLLIAIESCVLCGLCAKQCPVNAITVDRTARTWTVKRSDCLLCGACVQRCPKKCLEIGQNAETEQVSTFAKGTAAAADVQSISAVSDAKPAVKSEAPKTLHIGIESCVLCGLCAKQCPVNAITVDRAAKTWTVDRSACLLCGTCVQRCPKKCLGMGQASEATLQISVYTKS